VILVVYPEDETDLLNSSTKKYYLEYADENFNPLSLKKIKNDMKEAINPKIYG
jgi:hypothetical protein